MHVHFYCRWAEFWEASNSFGKLNVCTFFSTLWCCNTPILLPCAEHGGVRTLPPRQHKHLNKSSWIHTISWLLHVWRSRCWHYPHLILLTSSRVHVWKRLYTDLLEWPISSLCRSMVSIRLINWERERKKIITCITAYFYLKEAILFPFFQILISFLILISHSVLQWRSLTLLITQQKNFNMSSWCASHFIGMRLPAGPSPPADSGSPCWGPWSCCGSLWRLTVGPSCALWSALKC